MSFLKVLKKDSKTQTTEDIPPLHSWHHIGWLGTRYAAWRIFANKSGNKHQLIKHCKGSGPSVFPNTLGNLNSQPASYRFKAIMWVW